MAYADEVLADAPLAYYRLGEASGTTLVDSSGNARNGTYGGTPGFGATGLLTGDADTAVDFDGTADYATVPYAAWQAPSTFTIEAWFKFDGSTRVMVARRSGASSGTSDKSWTLFVGSGNIGIEVISPVGGVVYYNANSSPTAGTRYHYVVVYDGSSFKSYLNGALVRTDSYAAGIQSTTAPLSIGGWVTIGPSPTDLFDGVIDEVAYYGAALSAARIEAHYNTGTGAAPPTITGSLAATLPVLSASLAGSSAPPPVTGTLDPTLPALTFAGEGGSSAAETVGTLGATLPVLTVSLSGTVAPIGAIAASLPGLTTSLSGIVAAPGEISGVLAAQLPVIEALFRGGSSTPTTDTFNRRNGRTRSGTGWANLDEPVAAVPATITAEPIRVMAQTLPTPTLEKGRPV